MHLYKMASTWVPARKKKNSKEQKREWTWFCDLGPLKQETDKYYLTPRAEAYMPWDNALVHRKDLSLMLVY